MIQIETVNYASFGQCCRITNGLIEALVTLDVGPRVIRFGFVGGKNEFVEHAPAQLNPAEWNIFGGHRLWHAPEHPVRTYVPDNAPVNVTQAEGVVTFTQAVEAGTGIQKRIEIALEPSQAIAYVRHELVNTGLWAVTFAPWALSVMATGGTAIIPLPPRGSHPEDLLPSSNLVVWPYTDLGDARWKYGYEYVLLRQDPTSAPTHPQKIGVSSARWLAYVNDGVMFAKAAPYHSGARYPDMGCSVELFTNNWMLELETLGPVTEIQAGGSVIHSEKWALFRDVPAVNNDADVKTHVEPLLAQF